MEENDAKSKNMALCVQNTKINRLIEELNKKYTRKQIVILFLEISEKPDISIDFNFSMPYYLDKFLVCREDIALSEIGVLILSAAKIYSRRIDSILDGIQRMLAGIEKEESSKKAKDKIENAVTDSENIKEVVSKPTRKATKRSLPKDDCLYEAEIEPKSFKRACFEKVNEKKIISNLFEPPKNYFKNFKKYLDYRTNNKKLKKDDSKYDDNADISLYKHSAIEDFDYEDDIDSKRNYKSLHAYIEHRYSTVVSDINFLIHFKVKDFVEEENERFLDLETENSKKRKHFSLCHNEYINNLLELENEVLEKAFETKIKYKKRKRSDVVNSSCLESNSNLVIKEAEKSQDQTNLIDLNEISSEEHLNVSNEIIPINNTTTESETQDNIDCEPDMNVISDQSAPSNDISCPESLIENQTSIIDSTNDLNNTETELTNNESSDKDKENVIENESTPLNESSSLQDSTVSINITTNDLEHTESANKDIENNTDEVNISLNESSCIENNTINNTELSSSNIENLEETAKEDINNHLIDPSCSLNESVDLNNVTINRENNLPSDNNECVVEFLDSLLDNVEKSTDNQNDSVIEENDVPTISTENLEESLKDSVENTAANDDLKDKIENTTANDELKDKVENTTANDELNGKMENTTANDELKDKVENTIDSKELKDDNVVNTEQNKEPEDNVENTTDNNTDTLNNTVSSESNSINKETEPSTSGNDDNLEKILNLQNRTIRPSSEDEGIFLNDSEDPQSPLISPLKSQDVEGDIIDRSIKNFSLGLDENLENFIDLNHSNEKLLCPLNILGINEQILKFNEDFNLPSDYLIKEYPISINIFKIPEKKIKNC